MKLNMLTIKQKILLTVTFAVLLSAILVSQLSLHNSRQVVEQRMLGSELPNMLLRVRNEIDIDISVLLNAAEQVATDSTLLDSIENARPEIAEAQIVSRLKDIKRQYQLNVANYTDRQTAASYLTYGYDRLLSPERAEDSWYFDYKNSGKARMLDIYTEENGETNLYINYQQLNGRGMVGLAKSLDEMAMMLGAFNIEQSGFVYLVDAKGKVQLHRDTSQVGRATLKSLYAGADSSVLLNSSDFSLLKTDVNGEASFIASSYIASMGWYLIAQVPEDEVFALLEASTYQTYTWTALIVIFFIVFAIIVAASVSRPIARVADMLRNIGEGEGDLRQRLPVKGGDEVAMLAKGFNSFVGKIQCSVTEVAETSEQLSLSARSILNQAQQTHTDSQLQKDQTMMVVTAINEMAATVNDIAANAAQASDAAKDTDTGSTSGQRVVTQARETISQLSSDVEALGEVIESLATHTKSIDSVLDVIRAVSEQTNLLALNAAIEAARAGEAGRGFAVVADEVRNLASRTASSTNEVQAMIDKLQSEANRAVGAMAQSRSSSLEGVAAVDEASQSLITISEGIAIISDMNIQVAAATEEQSTVVENINRNMSDINDITQRNVDSGQDAAAACQSLLQLAHRLDSLVANFKI